MQTFLPLPPKKLDEPLRICGDVYIEWSYSNTFKLLDYRRLGKQRVEALQIYDAITRNTGWKNHPISKMWKPYPIALLAYGLECSEEWIRRGYTDNMYKEFARRIYARTSWIKFEPLMNGDVVDCTPSEFEIPWWMGEEEFHQSHRSNLLRKFPEHYRKFWDDPDDLPYVWYA